MSGEETWPQWIGRWTLNIVTVGIAPLWRHYSETANDLRQALIAAENQDENLPPIDNKTLISRIISLPNSRTYLRFFLILGGLYSLSTFIVNATNPTNDDVLDPSQRDFLQATGVMLTVTNKIIVGFTSASEIIIDKLFDSAQIIIWGSFVLDFTKKLLRRYNEITRQTRHYRIALRQNSSLSLVNKIEHLYYRWTHDRSGRYNPITFGPIIEHITYSYLISLINNSFILYENYNNIESLEQQFGGFGPLDGETTKQLITKIYALMQAILDSSQQTWSITTIKFLETTMPLIIINKIHWTYNHYLKHKAKNITGEIIINNYYHQQQAEKMRASLSNDNTSTAPEGYATYLRTIEATPEGYATYLRTIEAIVSTAPEGLTDGFLLLRFVNDPAILLLAIPAIYPMYIVERAWMGADIVKNAQPSERALSNISSDILAESNPLSLFLREQNPRPWINQACHLLAPFCYSAAVGQAAWAIGISPAKIAFLSLIQYNLQILKSFASYDQWAEANNATRVNDILPMKWQYQIFNSLGLNEFSKQTWTAIEWYIHYKALMEIGKIFAALSTEWVSPSTVDALEQLINSPSYSLLALYLGSCQTPFTFSFDISKYTALNEYLRGHMSIFTQSTSRIGRILAAIENFLNFFVTYTVGEENYLVNSLINAKCINSLKVFLLSSRGTLYQDLILKTLLGFIIGGLGGNTAYNELTNSVPDWVSFDLKAISILSLGGSYLMVNFIQGYWAKFPNARCFLNDYSRHSLWNRISYRQYRNERTPLVITENNPQQPPSITSYITTINSFLNDIRNSLSRRETWFDIISSIAGGCCFFSLAIEDMLPMETSSFNTAILTLSGALVGHGLFRAARTVCLGEELSLPDNSHSESKYEEQGKLQFL